MPYIVTTKRPDAQPYNAAHANIWRPVSRRAVATTEEAWRICDDAFAACPGYAENFTLLVPGESGGTVGPLPDGTVIKVEAITQRRAREDLRRWGSQLDTLRSPDDVIARAWGDAFNAREGRSTE